MPVYGIRAGEGPIKLGHTTDPTKRLGELQVACWEKLRILRLWEGGLAEEAMLHIRFADLHIRGDWFAFSRLMLSDVGLVQIAIQPKNAVSSLASCIDLGRPQSWRDVIELLGGMTALANVLGVDRVNTAGHWATRGIPARHHQRISELALAHGVKITPTIWKILSSTKAA